MPIPFLELGVPPPIPMANACCTSNGTPVVLGDVGEVVGESISIVLGVSSVLVNETEVDCMFVVVAFDGFGIFISNCILLVPLLLDELGCGCCCCFRPFFLNRDLLDL